MDHLISGVPHPNPTTYVPTLHPSRDAGTELPLPALVAFLSFVIVLGVLLSVGVTVGFGMSGDWWVRVLAGLATTVVLVVVVKLGTSAGRGPIARLARWVIGSGEHRAARR